MWKEPRAGLGRGLARRFRQGVCLLQDPYLCFTDQGRTPAPSSCEFSGAPSSHRAICSGLAMLKSCSSKPPHSAPGCVCGFLRQTLSGSGLGLLCAGWGESAREALRPMSAMEQLMGPERVLSLVLHDLGP